MSGHNGNRQNAVAFVSRIPQFQSDLSLLDGYLESLGAYQLGRLVPFLKETELLFIEPTLAGGNAYQTGNAFQQLTPADIPLFVRDIENGEYDAYL